MSGEFDGHNWCDLTQELDAEIDKTAGKVIRQQLPSYLADFRPALLGPLIGHVWFYMWRQFVFWSVFLFAFLGPAPVSEGDSESPSKGLQGFESRSR